MNGILNIIKPPGMTSFDVIGYLRKLLKIKKIGHAGTLDPGAVGVLPVCVGNATKAIEFLMEKDKLYRAELTLGISTETQDAFGQILGTQSVKALKEEIQDAVLSFQGSYFQIPPMYSAIKVGGKKLYELAREGLEVERKAREVRIYSINILDIQTFFVTTAYNQDMLQTVRVLFDVHCSKGTYIRTLCSDIGDKLGCGGHMSFLLRLKAGPFVIQNAVTLEHLKKKEEEGTIKGELLDIENIFEGWKFIHLNDSDLRKFLNGVLIPLNNGSHTTGEYLKICSEDGVFFAIGEAVQREGIPHLKSKKVFKLTQ